MNYDATQIPMKEAIADAQAKGLLPTQLTSRQLAELSDQVTRHAVFSATMDRAQVLQVIKDNLVKAASQVGLADENGRLRTVPEAKAQLKQALYDAGVPLAPVGTRPLQDFYSDTRRDLIVRTNLLNVLNFGRHVAGNDPIALDVNPGYELVRMAVPKGGVEAERDWVERWHDAMDDIGSDADEGCTDPDECGGRMVALKNHPIWEALGDGAGGHDDALGNSWAPYAYGSHMNRIDVPRAECVELGIIEADQQLEPDDDLDLTKNLEASGKQFDKALRNELAANSAIELVDGILRLANRSNVIAAKSRLRNFVQLKEAA